MSRTRLRDWLRAIRHVPDRIQHPFRRRSAMRRLMNDGNWFHQVLFVCHGNVCRSPFAEVLFAQRLRGCGGTVEGSRASSAGFIGPNRAPPSEALAAAGRVGVDLSSHRSRLLSADLLCESSLVVVMSGTQASLVKSKHPQAAGKLLVLGDLDPLPIATRTVADPWNKSADVFDESYARIDRCVQILVACAQGMAKHTTPSVTGSLVTP